MTKCFKLILLLALLQNISNSQVTSLGKNIYVLTRYLASSEFYSLKEKIPDISQVDSLYLKAMEVTGKDISETLLSLTFTTIPYNTIPVVTPTFKIKINIPLPSASDSLFKLKNKNLPKYILADSPQNHFGDKDKLAHFFGSAYLSYTSGIFDFTEIIGIFVEDFEENFYIQAKADPRDLVADYLGNLYGKALKKNKDLLPSGILVSYYLLSNFTYEFYLNNR